MRTGNRKRAMEQGVRRLEKKKSRTIERGTLGGGGGHEQNFAYEDLPADAIGRRRALKKIKQCKRQQKKIESKICRLDGIHARKRANPPERVPTSRGGTGAGPKAKGTEVGKS